MPGLNITSEIGNLKRVILHTPGPEVEAMTPREAVEDLYNDILLLEAVKAEHDQLKSFLGLVAEVSELKDLLAESLVSPGNRFEFLTALSGLCPIKVRIDELMALSPVELAGAAIEGLPAHPGSLAYRNCGRAFSMRPLPNSYFMRDTAAVVRDYAIASPVAFDVRLVESIITRFIFTHHPGMRAKGLLLDGPKERNRYVTLEGGDVLVMARNVLAIGISGRTTPDAIEALAKSAGRVFEEPFTVLAVVLPRERATIHLDMVFTMIDRDAALVYAPVVTGRDRARVFRLDISHAGVDRIEEEEGGLLPALKRLGHDLEPVPCGGGDLLFGEREQWWSGANSFAFGPGRIVMYSCNVRTLDALSAVGFEVKRASEMLPVDGRAAVDPTSYRRLVVGFDGIELARGGGGARCMTLPVEREEL